MLSLKPARVHEASGDGAFVFALLAMARAARSGETLCIGAPDWLGAFDPNGIARLADPQAMLHVACPLKADVLWAAETALRAGAAATVLIALYSTPDHRSFRRLQLAAEAGRTLGIVLVRQAAFTSPAETRWHCSPCRENGQRGLHVSLYKNKSGVEGSWYLYGYGDKKTGDTDHGGLVAAPAGDPVWPGRVAR